MTTTTTTEARKNKLDQRTTAIKKARARLRQTQRQEQAKRLQKLGEFIEASWGKKLSATDEEMLGRVLALASSSPLSLAEVLGAVVVVRDKLASPDGEQTRANLNARAAGYLGAL